MIGGAISGNCAIGRVRPATAPIRVISTEITPARTGRSTKRANIGPRQSLGGRGDRACNANGFCVFPVRFGAGGASEGAVQVRARAKYGLIGAGALAVLAGGGWLAAGRPAPSRS